MKYPDTSKLTKLSRELELYGQLKAEQGAREAIALTEKAVADLSNALEKLRALVGDESLAKKEPDDLATIRELRPEGPRRLLGRFDEEVYRQKVEGALLARMAGCILGSIVEGWSIERMEQWAEETGDAFPPVDYWSEATMPRRQRYGKSYCSEYTRSGMNGVPVDDDLTYTLLGLLIAEDHGAGFTVEEVGKAWLKYLPYAATAERVALDNLKKGVTANEAALKDNPFYEWIGADIRSDPWGYLAPGFPEKAASMAYHDAFISHRRNGIYGEMFFSAAISACFAVDDLEKAMEIGLSEIPAECRLAEDVAWALKQEPADFREARGLVDQRFEGMSHVHTNNNACLTIFGLKIGGTDVTRVLSQTVAMGMDNDCTTATAGSLVGALVGRSKIPAHWNGSFNNTVHSYIIDHPLFEIDKLIDRFTKKAGEISRA
jgi:ADP-ribosylglycohydrolase